MESSVALPLMSVFSALQVNVLDWSEGLGLNRTTEIVKDSPSTVCENWKKSINFFFLCFIKLPDEP